MEQLVKLVSERAGIPPEQARVAVETVLGFLKERLPAPIASQIDGVVGNTGGSSGGLGGLFGR
jgi:uncharacterized protein (DUF2267 family)